MTHPKITLQSGHNRRVSAGHPWVYSNEIDMNAEAKALPPGSVVTLTDPHGHAFATAFFNPHSLIAARILVRKPDIAIDSAFFAERLGKAKALRDVFFPEGHYRLVHAEADGLPGLVIDRFGDTCVIQANSAGVSLCMDSIVTALEEVLAPRRIILRGDSSARDMEGMASEVRVLKGPESGPIEVIENGARFAVDPLEGQKTGWFFDHRPNRTFIKAIAKDRRILDMFCYAGAFSIAAAMGGASEVVGIDRSELALASANAAAETNGVSEKCTFLRGEAFAEMERLATAGESFDIVIVDPPAFVKSKKDLFAGLKGYRKMARLAARLVRPGGFMLAASCSHNASPAEFQQEICRGASESGRTGRVIHTGGAGPDHPVHPQLPESAYLKTMIMQLD
ncbi:MAG TPA: RlmI/RlmK family 23S rRNA methyltransferase [Rhodospirillaceae bacterium]|nr:MAG: SAM-dependent methyltransferase [Alphaproteobacteria bacterium GWF2_58_20]HAU29953.1 RlmI/RlmK family 23S rRNA methyltransferase [Rhodospirillaceae bacterium]